MKIYIAGPMTGRPDLNFPAFFAAAHALRSMGLEVANPAELNPDPKTPWIQCMRRDITELLTCDQIYLLRGWETSKGARLEHHIAVHLNLELVMEELGTTGRGLQTRAWAFLSRKKAPGTRNVSENKSK